MIKETETNRSGADVYIVKKLYLLAGLLVIGQISGGLIADISVIIAFLVSFIYFSFTRKLDILLIFMFLIPSIVLRNIHLRDGFFLQFGYSDYKEHTWLQFALPNLKDVFMLGPVALSAKLGLALAVPVRLLKTFKNSSYRNYKVLWFMVLLIAIIGLILSVLKGIESDSGITVGFRIVLSMGTMFLPLCITNRQVFEKDILHILEISLIMFILGLLNEHWLFVLTGVLPYLYIKTSRLLIKLLVLIASFIMLIMDFTFTFKGILILSIIFYFLIDWNIFFSFLKTRTSRYLVLLIPVFLTVLIIFSDHFLLYSGDSQLKRFSDKLNSDRKVLWEASYDLIASSSPFIVPGGRPIPVDNFQGLKEWDSGAHSIYLEISRQLGLTAFIILFFGFLKILENLWAAIELKEELILFSGLLSVFMVFGFTGNSLVYDGVGFLFWFIIGQFARLRGV